MSTGCIILALFVCVIEVVFGIAELCSQICNIVCVSVIAFMREVRKFSIKLDVRCIACY